MKNKNNAKGDLDTGAEEGIAEELNNAVEEEQIEPVSNPRDAALQASVVAARKVREQAESDYVEENGSSSASSMLMIEDEKEEVAEEPADDDLDPTAKEVVDIADEVTDTQFVTRGKERFLKLNVNGVDQELSIAEAVKRLQMNENADMKLYQATQILKQANEKQQPQGSTLPDDNSETVLESNAALKDALTNLYDGDIDVATETLSKLFNTRSTTQAPIDIDTAVAASLLKQEDQRNLSSAYKAFESSEDFSFIAKDPVLLKRLDDITSDLEQDSAYMSNKPSYADIFTEAGTQVKSWLESVSGSVSQSQPNKNDKLLALKEKKGAGITPGSGRRNTVPDVVKKPLSRADIIADMANKRGQTIYDK
jgi:hypothetical protein